MRQLDIFGLKKLVWSNFDDKAIPLFCDEAGIDENSLPNKGLIEKANYLVDEVVKTGRARDIFNVIHRLRPDLINGIFSFDDNEFLSKEALLRDPTLISVPLSQPSERIIQFQLDDPNANALLNRIQESSNRLEVLSDPISQERLFTKLEEASQIVRSKWNEPEYLQKLGRAEFLINSTSAEITRLDKLRELRVADVNRQIEAENKVRQDEAKLTWIIPAIVIFYVILVISAIVFTYSIASGDPIIPLINVPLSILVWAAIGSLSALIYRYYRRIKKSSLISEIRLAIGKFWVGIVSGAIFYFSVRSGLFILSNQQVDINQSPLGQQQLMWVLVWLISFSDFVFERVITRLSGNVVGEESEKSVSSIFGVNVSDISDTIERSNSRQLSEFRRLRAELIDIANEIKSNKEIEPQVDLDIENKDNNTSTS
jgi:hypothetical protein